MSHGNWSDEEAHAYIQAGSTAAIAFDRGIKPIFAAARNQLYQTVLAYYREGEHGSKLFSALGELAGIDSMEARIVSIINRGKGAERSLTNEGTRNVSHGEDRNY